MQPWSRMLACKQTLKGWKGIFRCSHCSQGCGGCAESCWQLQGKPANSFGTPRRHLRAVQTSARTANRKQLLLRKALSAIHGSLEGKPFAKSCAAQPWPPLAAAAGRAMQRQLAVFAELRPRFDFLLQLSQYFQHNFPATSAILPSLLIFSQPSVCLKFEPNALFRLGRCAKQEYVHTTHTGAFHPWQHLCLKYHVVCQFLYCEISIKNSTTIDAKAQTVAASSSCLLGFYQNLLHFMKFGPFQRTLRLTQKQT